MIAMKTKNTNEFEYVENAAVKKIGFGEDKDWLR